MIPTLHLDVCKRRGISPIGEPLVLIQPELFSETYTVTCMCSNSEIFISTRINSNTQLDFFNFIVDSINKSYLKYGDYLVIDNASIHGGLDTIEILIQFLEAEGINLIYLPTYSPELNPCELIFAQVKRYLRENRDSTVSLLFDIGVGFAIPTVENLSNYYSKCCRTFQ